MFVAKALMTKHPSWVTNRHSESQFSRYAEQSETVNAGDALFLYSVEFL